MNHRPSYSERERAIEDAKLFIARETKRFAMQSGNIQGQSREEDDLNSSNNGGFISSSADFLEREMKQFEEQQEHSNMNASLEKKRHAAKTTDASAAASEASLVTSNAQQDTADEDKAYDLDLYETNPSAWRLEVMPFRTDDPVARAQARRQGQEQFRKRSIENTFERDEQVTDSPICDRIAFAVFTVNGARCQTKHAKFGLISCWPSKAIGGR